MHACGNGRIPAVHAARQARIVTVAGGRGRRDGSGNRRKIVGERTGVSKADAHDACCDCKFAK